MTATYNPAEVERLVREARKRYAATGTVGTADALDMADQLEAAQAEIDRLRALWESTPLSVTSVAFENQRLRERIESLESALREACAMLRGCRSGDGQPTITTSKIDALLAVADGAKP